jgi:hypothetical protein
MPPLMPPLTPHVAPGLLSRILGLFKKSRP